MINIRWAGRLWPTAAPAFLLAGCTTLDGPAVDALTIEGDVLVYGSWAVGCNNLRQCTAIVPLTEPSRIEAPFYLAMRHPGAFSDGDGFAIMRDGLEYAKLSQATSEMLLRELRKPYGPEAIRIAETARPFDVPRSGFAHVIAVLEAWRARLPSAASSSEVVTPLPAVRIDKPIPPFKVTNGAKRCPKGHMGQSLQAWRGISGQTLWKAGCGNEGLNSASFWYVAGPQGAPAMEIQLEDRDGPVALYNSWFDAENGYLHSASYFGHHESFTEDCGIYRTFAWVAEGMKLVEQREMPQCETGLGPEAWIITYRATLVGGADPRP